MNLLFERNSIINILVITLSVSLAILVHPLYLLLWPAIIIIDDIIDYGFGKSIFDSDNRVARSYQVFHFFLDNTTQHGRDLGFNLYDGDFSKTREQSQKDKWDFMLKELDLKPGDSLIDIGCGYGDWINYARSKGINVTGVNITPEHVEHCKKAFALDAYCLNWKDIPKREDLRKKFYGKYDAVTFMDTVEHYVSSKHRNDMKAQGEVYTAMFKMAYDLLKLDSHSGKVFISCLHLTRHPEKLGDWISCYLQDRTHSGFYPSGDDGLTKWANDYFTELCRYDKTEDYRLTSVLDKSHFGDAIVKLTFKKILMVPIFFIVDPHLIHKWIDFKLRAWMWHFGEDKDKLEYDPDADRNKRFVTLWWLTLQKKQN